MKKITITVPDDKVEEVQAMLQKYIQQLNISILKEDEKLMVEEWHRDTVVKDESSGGYISSDEIEKTSFSREKWHEVSSRTKWEIFWIRYICLNRLPDPTTPEFREQPDGRGVFLMRKLADEVFFRDGGRCVEMRFLLSWLSELWFLWFIWLKWFQKNFAFFEYLREIFSHFYIHVHFFLFRYHFKTFLL